MNGFAGTIGARDSVGDVVGTWGSGVFENDAAEDLLETFRSLEDGAREELLRRVVTTSAVHGADPRKVDPAEALACVAVVAIGLSGEPSFSGAEEHPGIDSWMSLALLFELRPISLRVLDVVERECSWYWHGWRDEREEEEALGEVAKMRRMLSL